MTDADFDAVRRAAEDAKCVMLAARAVFDDAIRVQVKAQSAYFDAKATWHRADDAFQGAVMQREREKRKLERAQRIAAVKGAAA